MPAAEQVSSARMVMAMAGIGILSGILLVATYIGTLPAIERNKAAALERAAQRGVICRVLVDDVGASRFLRSRKASRLRAAGVQVVRQLPVGLLRMLFVRMDLRNHRKIAVIDGGTGYTGSMNLVDPAFFKTDAGVGRWVDVMVRLRGPAVEVLNGTFLEDWERACGVPAPDEPVTATTGCCLDIVCPPWIMDF